jgi:hypothetical protein
MTASQRVCEHNNAVRAFNSEVSGRLNSALSTMNPRGHLSAVDDERRPSQLTRQMNPERRTILPAVAFRAFATRYTPPRLEEGFQEVMELDFRVGLRAGCSADH